MPSSTGCFRGNMCHFYGLCHAKSSLNTRMASVVVIPKEGWACMAITILLLVWHQLTFREYNCRVPPTQGLVTVVWGQEWRAPKRAGITRWLKPPKGVTLHTTVWYCTSGCKSLYTIQIISPLKQHDYQLITPNTDTLLIHKLTVGHDTIIILNRVVLPLEHGWCMEIFPICHPFGEIQATNNKQMSSPCLHNIFLSDLVIWPKFEPFNFDLK